MIARHAGRVPLDRALRVLHLDVRRHVGLRLELALGDAVDVFVLGVLIAWLVRGQLLRRLPLFDQHDVLRMGLYSLLLRDGVLR